MSSNAGKWFYQEPENKPYFVSERLNNTFWTARVVDVYWQCTRAEVPFAASGYVDDKVVSLEWAPNQWLRFTAPPDLSNKDYERIVDAISKRILHIDASLEYDDPDGNRSTEWYKDGAGERWDEIQGQPEYVKPRRV